MIKSFEYLFIRTRRKSMPSRDFWRTVLMQRLCAPLINIIQRPKTNKTGIASILLRRIQPTENDKCSQSTPLSQKHTQLLEKAIAKQLKQHLCLAKVHASSSAGA